MGHAVDGGERGEILGCIDGKEGVRGEGGGLLSYCVYGAASTAVKEDRIDDSDKGGALTVLTDRPVSYVRSQFKLQHT